MNRTVALLLSLALCLGARAARAQEIAITFDDLPAHSRLPPGETRAGIAAAVIDALKGAGAPQVYGFVNGVRIEEEPASASVLPAWRAAGFPLGDHSWSHMNLNTHTAAEFEADVTRNQPLLEAQMGGGDWRWFRYPFLSEGDTPAKQAEIRAFLGARGYRIAAVTMNFGDYAWNEPYARCVAQGDKAAIAELERLYLEDADLSITYYRGLSKALYGHDIPYVLLMHIGAMDARMAPRLLALYRARGFRFVTLDAAEKHPFYRQDVDLSLPAGPNNLEGETLAHHLPLPPKTWDLARIDAFCPKRPG